MCTSIYKVKAEAAKFDMERDEFMNVEGEAEFDVDIMKELRCASSSLNPKIKMMIKSVCRVSLTYHTSYAITYRV